jgi:hypothetical protein
MSALASASAPAAAQPQQQQQQPQQQQQDPPQGSATSGRAMSNAAQKHGDPAARDDPFELENAGKVREIGEGAVWSVSSCKPGFGVEQLRDNLLDTYWQSDGPQPHLVNIQFHR